MASPGVPPALLSLRSSVRRRAMFLVMDKAGLSDEDEQKCGKMFNYSSRIKRRVERRNEQLNLLPRLRHTLSHTQKLVFFLNPLNILNIPNLLSFLSPLNGNRAFLKNNFIISPQKEHILFIKKLIKTFAL